MFFTALTNAAAEDAAIDDEEGEADVDRSKARGDACTEEGHIVDDERVGPGLVAKETSRYTTDGVEDTQQGQQHRRLIVVNTQRLSV